MNAVTSKVLSGWTGVLVLCLFTLTGCLNIPANQPVDPLLASGIPDHTAFGSTPCVTCHALDRPPPTIQAVTGIQVMHGGGRDCGECHVAGGASWRSFVNFSHSPLPVTCADCHITAQPTALVNEMLHAYPGVGDCVDCHAADAGVTWTKGTYAHEPIPGTCVECHAAQRPATVVNAFSHEAGGMGDCASCHHSVGVTWSGGAFSHSPTPAKCSDCHAGDRPTGSVGPSPGFDHAAANGAGLGDCKSCHSVFSATQKDWSGGSFSHVPSPTSCIDCHVGKRPVGVVGTPPFDHAATNGAGLGDCVSCHKVTTAQPTATDWSGATFSHSPTPASCIGCHAADRPTGLAGTPSFDHAADVGAGLGDCKSCHQQSAATKLWSGGFFNHVPVPTTCIECHLSKRPAGPVGTPPFDHVKNGGTGDCVACHHNPGVAWTGAIAVFDHNTLAAGTRCDSCHEAQRPAAAINVAWPGHASNPNQFLHSLQATVDCKGCHLDPGGAWAGGLYSHVPDPGQCNVCHLGQRPVGPAGSPVFDHALGGTGDCAACHAVKSATKTDWTGGNFTHTSAITACAQCHIGNRPTGKVGPAPGFDHSIGGTGDCISCHAMKSATKTDWTGGNFSHLPKPTTCAGCHLAEKPAAAMRGSAVSTDGKTYTNDYVHSLVTGDCAGCHTVTTATPVAANWQGGYYTHSPAPASCATCHAVTRPDATYTAFNHTQAGLADCKTCHAYPGQKWTGASAVPSSVTLTPPSGKTAWGNIVAPHPVIDAAKVGLACSTCHGANTSAQIIGYDHAKPVTGSKCVYCHFTGQTETSFAVVTKSHNSASNTKDCTASGCHQPTYPTWNVTSKIFSGGKWDQP